MVDVTPPFIGGVLIGTTINVTGTAVTGAALVGDWVVGCNGLDIRGVAIGYSEAGGGTLTDATLSFQVLLEGDTVAYTVVTGAAVPVAWAIAITATADTYHQFAPNAITAGQIPGGFNGIKAIRATAAITGTGATTDKLKVTFVGMRIAS